MNISTQSSSLPAIRDLTRALSFCRPGHTFVREPNTSHHEPSELCLRGSLSPFASPRLWAGFVATSIMASQAIDKDAISRYVKLPASPQNAQQIVTTERVATIYKPLVFDWSDDEFEVTQAVELFSKE